MRIQTLIIILSLTLIAIVVPTPANGQSVTQPVQGLQLTIADETTPNQPTSLALRITSTTQTLGVLEQSSNLITWIPILTNTFRPVPSLFPIPHSLLGNHGYYRVRVVPAAPVGEEKGATLGPLGGRITLTDGAEVVVPSGHIQGEEEFVLRKRDIVIENSSIIQNEVQTVYDIELPGEIGDITITLTLPIEKESADDGAATDVVILAYDEVQSVWQPVMVAAEDGDHEINTHPIIIDQTKHLVTLSFTISAPSSALSRAGVKAINKKTLMFKKEQTTTEAQFTDVENMKVLNVFKQKTVKTLNGGIVTKTVLTYYPTNHSFPFKATSELGLDRHFVFDVTSDHSPEEYFRWEGSKSTTRPADVNDKGNQRRTRSLNEITHIVVHDYGPLSSTSKALRNILRKQQANYAPYYVDTAGNIFQVAPLEREVWHSLSNNRNTVGIEMEPLRDEPLKPGERRFAQATLDATAKLTSALIRRLHLPFDPEIELLVRQAAPEPKDRFYNRGTPIKANDTFVVLLPYAARHTTIVGHLEIQKNKPDPSSFNWTNFIGAVSSFLSGDAYPASLIDCSSTSGFTSSQLAGGNVSFTTIKGLDLGKISLGKMKEDDALIHVAPGKEREVALPVKAAKVYVSENAVLKVNVGPGENYLDTGSFYLSKGAKLVLRAATANSKVFIRSERILQIDGMIDGRGFVSAGTNYPVSLILQTGATDFVRIPSIISRGGNSRDISVAGGDGGAVTIMGSDAILDATALFGGVMNGGQVSTTTPYHQREIGDFFGYGGTSFRPTPSAWSPPGIITSGGSGAGGDSIAVGDTNTTRMQGGNGGKISIQMGTNVFNGPFYLISGAIPPTSGICETIRINYSSASLLDVVVPSGGNGGRGRISFGNLNGGNGGNGGNAGQIDIAGTLPLSLLTETSFFQLLDGRIRQQGKFFSFSRPVSGKVLVLSAVGGSGGPLGGDTTTGSPGSDGKTGLSASITVGGKKLQ